MHLKKVFMKMGKKSALEKVQKMLSKGNCAIRKKNAAKKLSFFPPKHTKSGKPAKMQIEFSRQSHKI